MPGGGQKFWTRLVSTEEVSTEGWQDLWSLESGQNMPAMPPPVTARQVQGTVLETCGHNIRGQVLGHSQGEGNDLLGIKQQETNSTASPPWNIQQSHLFPRPSLVPLAWEPAAEASAPSWPRWGPKGGEKNVVAWWPPGPWGDRACP